jgi:hypothetical protein
MKVAEKIKSGVDEAELLNIMNDPSVSDVIVSYMRLINSANLRIEEDYYSYVLAKDETMEQFCVKVSISNPKQPSIYSLVLLNIIISSMLNLWEPHKKTSMSAQSAMRSVLASA